MAGNFFICQKVFLARQFVRRKYFSPAAKIPSTSDKSRAGRIDAISRRMNLIPQFKNFFDAPIELTRSNDLNSIFDLCTYHCGKPTLI